MPVSLREIIDSDFSSHEVLMLLEHVFSEGRWVTIGAGEGEGGTPVYLDDGGEISKGPSGLKNKNIKQIDKNKSKDAAPKKTRPPWISREKWDKQQAIESKEQAWADSLNDAEAESIRSWTDGQSDGVLADIRAGRDTLQVQAFKSAVEKAPTYEGTVHRSIGVESSSPLLSKNVGDTVTFDQYASASRSVSEARQFSDSAADVGQVPVRFEIEQQSGKAISRGAADQFGSQQEVVMKPGSRFRIAEKSVRRGAVGDGVDEHVWKLVELPRRTMSKSEAGAGGDP